MLQRTSNQFKTAHTHTTAEFIILVCMLSEQRVAWIIITWQHSHRGVMDYHHLTAFTPWCHGLSSLDSIHAVVSWIIITWQHSHRGVCGISNSTSTQIEKSASSNL